MKSILRPACTLAVASLLFTASLRAADALPGLVSFGKFTKPTNGELVEINLTSDMIAMAMQLAGKGQPEFTEALNGLHSVSVNVVGLDDQNRDEVTSRMKSVRAQLDASGWQPVVKVQEKKEDVGIYLKTRGSEAIEGVVITVLEGRKQAVFINVAGNLRERMIFNMSEEEWDSVIRVHLKGTYNTTHFASIHWRTERKGGYRLINFSSGAGINGSPGQPNYAAAKAGLIGFTKSCANALARYGVTANAIAPGAATRMTDRNLGNQQATREGDPASERSEGTPRDPLNVAPILVYLCSEEGANVSGRVIGASGYQITLYRDMDMERQIFSDGPWNVDELWTRAKEQLTPHLALPNFNAPSVAGA